MHRIINCTWIRWLGVTLCFIKYIQQWNVITSFEFSLVGMKWAWIINNLATISKQPGQRYKRCSYDHSIITTKLLIIKTQHWTTLVLSRLKSVITIQGSKWNKSYFLFIRTNTGSSGLFFSFTVFWLAYLCLRNVDISTSPSLSLFPFPFFTGFALDQRISTLISNSDHAHCLSRQWQNGKFAVRIIPKCIILRATVWVESNLQN